MSIAFEYIYFFISAKKHKIVFVQAHIPKSDPQRKLGPTKGPGNPQGWMTHWR